MFNVENGKEVELTDFIELFKEILKNWNNAWPIVFYDVKYMDGAKYIVGVLYKLVQKNRTIKYGKNKNDGISYAVLSCFIKTGREKWVWNF